MKLKINLIPDTYMQQIAPQEVQNRYSQLNSVYVEELLIKFFKKEGRFMEQEVRYVIVSDVDNMINYQEVYDKQVDRTVVQARREKLEEYRKKLEELRVQEAEVMTAIADIEAEIEVSEKIIALADAKKAEEEVATEETVSDEVEAPAQPQINV